MAAGLRNDFAKRMTSAQITEAQQRAREWKPLKVRGMTYRWIYMTRTLLITLLVLISGPAYAEWMSLGSSESGTTVYADPATIRREGDLVKMLVLFDFKTKQTKADISYLSAKAQMEYDCAEQRFEGHSVLYFSDNMGNGPLLDRSSGKGKWLRISPGSLDHDLWKLACGKK